MHLRKKDKYVVLMVSWLNLPLNVLHGTEPLTFPNAVLGLTIQNAESHEKFSLMSAEVITVLDSGGTKSVKWDQKDSNGQQVGPGNYTASISTGLLTANMTFSILQ